MNEETIKELTVAVNRASSGLRTLALAYGFNHSPMNQSAKNLLPCYSKMLWDNLVFPFVDMVLIGIYSGWRPQELAILKVSNVNLDERVFSGGLKTDAGRNRTVPIHDKIFGLVKRNYEKAISMDSEYLFNDENGQQGTYLTYNKYRGRFNKINKKFHFSHKPHDTRHTFITKGKKAQMDEYLLKIIVGHEISDVTEKVYTHRSMEELRNEIQKIQ